MNPAEAEDSSDRRDLLASTCREPRPRQGLGPVASVWAPGQSC